MYEELEVMKNNATGNNFQVVGMDSHHDLKAGIRFWIGAMPYTGFAFIGFRIRFMLVDGVAAIEGMQQKCEKAYPKAKWSGGSSVHGSVAGGIKTQYPAWQADNILEALKVGDAGGVLYDGLSGTFETLRILFDRPGFIDYFMYMVETMLKGGSKDTSKEIEIDFMGYKKTMNGETNEEVTIAEPPKAIASASLEEPQAL